MPNKTFRFELFVALRYLFKRHKQSFISVISLISALAVCLGVTALIVVMGIMNGMNTDLRDKLLGVNAHVVVEKAKGGFADYSELKQKLEATPGVVAVAPVIAGEVILSTPHGAKGLKMRGIDPKTAANAYDIFSMLEAGEIDRLRIPPTVKGLQLPGIILGRELSRRLGVSMNALATLVSPTGRRTSAGFAPNEMTFRIVGQFHTGIFEFDAALAFVSLKSAQELLGFKTITATGLELKVSDIYGAGDLARKLANELGPEYKVRDWTKMNQNLFIALKMQKTAMFVVLVLIILVGCFSIISALVLLVMEKVKDIAVLASMGATGNSIRRIFIYQGVLIGLIGTTLGYIFGLTLCFLLMRYKFIKLPRGVYTLDYLPVRLDSLDLTLIGVAALLLCYLATLYPARKAAKLNPADALRFE